jgi:cobaltochelatase CobT
MSTEDTQVSAEDMPDAAAEAVDAPTADMADDNDMGDAETPGEPQRPRFHGDNAPRGPDYRAFTMKFDETVAAEELCETEELDRLRGYLDKQLSHLQGVVARLANRLQRRLMAQQNRSWEFDLERPTSIRRGCRASWSIPCIQPRHSGGCCRETWSTRGGGAPNHGRRHLRHIPARTPALRGVRSRSSLHHRARKGGQRARAMVTAGKPANPGAPNDLRHIIYKSADAPAAALAKISA